MKLGFMQHETGATNYCLSCSEDLHFPAQHVKDHNTHSSAMHILLFRKSSFSLWLQQLPNWCGKARGSNAVCIANWFTHDQLMAEMTQLGQGLIFKPINIQCNLHYMTSQYLPHISLKYSLQFLHYHPAPALPRTAHLNMPETGPVQLCTKGDA